MNYTEALEYIHSICWTFTKPGLERISALCEKLGNPQDDLKFIHVAGTNGKGSVCAMTAEILKNAGYKTGLFTSPFIEVFNKTDILKAKSMVKTRDIQRMLYANAMDVTPDKQGRILIPNNLREYAGIDKDVVSVGVLSRVEIWSKEKWSDNGDYDDMDEIAEHMAELGFGI